MQRREGGDTVVKGTGLLSVLTKGSGVEDVVGKDDDDVLVAEGGQCNTQVLGNCDSRTYGDNGWGLKVGLWGGVWGVLGGS